MDDPMKMIARFMEVSARTAPKAGGVDNVETRVLEGGELDELADAMIDYGEESGKSNFDRDGENVRNSDAVILFYLKDPTICLLDCGACGYLKCEDFKIRSTKGTVNFNPDQSEEEKPEFEGPICAWRLLDLGIALGSAVKTASIFNVDSRIMYRIGAVARRIGLIEGEIVVGVPISATGKNIYFDR